jgi:hypothetical protein
LNSNDPSTPVSLGRAVLNSIATKLQQKQQQQQQVAQAQIDPAQVALMNADIQAAEQAGNASLSIALKQQLRRYLTLGYPWNLK